MYYCPPRDHNVLFNHVSNAIVCVFFFFTCWSAIWNGTQGAPPSSCEYFPTESCSSLKACTSRRVLAANEVRSHFEGKVFTFVLRRYFLHISPPFLRMSTDGTTSKAVPKSQISVNETAKEAK